MVKHAKKGHHKAHTARHLRQPHARGHLQAHQRMHDPGHDPVHALGTWAPESGQQRPSPHPSASVDPLARLQTGWTKLRCPQSTSQLRPSPRSCYLLKTAAAAGRRIATGAAASAYAASPPPHAVLVERRRRPRRRVRRARAWRSAGGASADLTCALVAREEIRALSLQNPNMTFSRGLFFSRSRPR